MPSINDACLAAVGSKLCHSGIGQPMARSTLADANEKCNWRVLADFAHVRIEPATALCADKPFGVELRQVADALDATAIDLCLSLFPWAKFRRHQAAITLHTLLALRGNFPTVVMLSPVNWTNSLSGFTHPIVVPATLPTKFYRLFKP